MRLLGQECPFKYLTKKWPDGKIAFLEKKKQNRVWSIVSLTSH